MDAGFLNMLHDACDVDIFAIADRIDIHFGRIGQVAVDKERGIAGYLKRLGCELAQVVVIACDFHRAAAEHEARAQHDRVTDFVRLDLSFIHTSGGPGRRLLDAELVEQGSKLFAVFGEVDRLGTCAQDRDVLPVQRTGKFQRCLSAELDNHAAQVAGAAFLVDDLKHVFIGQRFEIQAVGRIIVRGHRFRIAVHHDRLDAEVFHREGGVTAAIIELDALADPVRAAAQDHDFFPCGGQGFTVRLVLAEQRMLIGGVQVRRLRREFGGAGVDALVDRAHIQSMTLVAYRLFGLAGQFGEAFVGEAHGLNVGQRVGVVRQALRTDLVFRSDDFLELAQEPFVDGGDGVDFVHAEA